MSERPKLSALAIAACGAWLLGLGLYFAFLRPALLPEDARYVGSSLEKIRADLPGLERWLGHVFTVMGGFMAGSGMLAVFVAVTAVPQRCKGTAALLSFFGLSTLVTMSWSNFAINSDYKWLLLAPAALWIAGVGVYLVEGRRP